MGIAIPRPQMRSRERRSLEWSLRRHNELTRQFEADGMSRAAKAYEIVRTEKPLRSVCNNKDDPRR
jgi:hypothetical protein